MLKDQLNDFDNQRWGCGKKDLVKFLTNRAEKNLNLFKQAGLDQAAILHGPARNENEMRLEFISELNQKKKMTERNRILFCHLN